MLCCDQDEGIDGHVKPCYLDPEDLGHYVALRRQYDYLALTIFVRFQVSLVLYEERDCDPREKPSRLRDRLQCCTRVFELVSSVLK